MLFAFGDNLRRTISIKILVALHTTNNYVNAELPSMNDL